MPILYDVRGQPPVVPEGTQHQDPRPPMISQTVSIAVVASRLGVSPFTIRAWIRQGRVPCVKLGRRVLLRVEDVEQLLKENYKLARRPW
jgi:excisionase family DNA binding protein